MLLSAVARFWRLQMLSRAPLLCARRPRFIDLLPTHNPHHNKTTAVARHGTRWVLMDRTETESLGQLSRLSRELGVPITSVSFSRGRSPA